ncbi:MAG: non-homologous end-joining DNA ligase [Acidimicrobiales bacterium]
MSVRSPAATDHGPPVLGPMLAGGIGMPAEPSGWVFEPKWDGVRAIARTWDSHVTLASRLGNDVTGGYPELAALAGALGGRSAVLDGEIIAFDGGGRPSFERLQRRMHVRQPSPALMAEVPVLFVVFDLLWIDGRSLIDEPFTERRRQVEALGLRGPNWHTSNLLPQVPDQEALAACRRLGLEGYVAKLATSVYLPGKRSKAWTKVKCLRRREFVVGGWSPGVGGRSGQVGSLAVGWVDPQLPPSAGHSLGLRYAGQVGSGLSDSTLGHLASTLGPMECETSPFVAPPAPPGGLHFVRPGLVVEVMFHEMTTAGVLRQPSFKGLRNDLRPEEVVWTEELGQQP